MKDGIKIRGFSRVRILENGKIKGDSGLVGPNIVVNKGFEDICKQLGNGSPAWIWDYIGLGTGTTPNATHTTLNGEIMGSTQKKVVVDAVIGSKTLRLTVTFASSDNFLTAAANVRNIGIFCGSHVTGSLQNAVFHAGNTYASSSCNTNQDINATYEIQFS